MDRRQTLVPRDDSTPALFFEVIQELSHALGGHVDDGQAIDGFAGAPGDGWEQQAQGIAVTPLGIPGEIPLADHVLHQEPANPRAKQGCITHGYPPRGRTARSACRPAAAVPASWSDKLECAPSGHAQGKRTSDTPAVAHPPPGDTNRSVDGPRRYAENHEAEADGDRRLSAARQHIPAAAQRHPAHSIAELPSHVE